jgi:hypothetical protein
MKRTLDLDDDGVIERDDDEDPQTEGFAAILDGDGGPGRGCRHQLGDLYRARYAIPE